MPCASSYQHSRRSGAKGPRAGSDLWSFTGRYGATLLTLVSAYSKELYRPLDEAALSIEGKVRQVIGRAAYCGWIILASGV
ncbi:MAG: hypothetical protein P8J79_05760 [Halioglobus sp.]|nr:hypothetical protein [Halioglobus sp.]